MYEFKIITSIILLNDEKKVLLAKRSEDEDVFPGLWAIPGGKVEHGPEMVDVLEDNVQKELEEEIGVKAHIDDYVESHSDGKGKIYITFKGMIKEGTPKPLEDTEKVDWFSLKEIDQDKLCPMVWYVLQKTTGIQP